MYKIYGTSFHGMVKKEDLRLNSYSTEEMKKEMDKSRKEELEREL